jgi:hypothetical protein
MDLTDLDQSLMLMRGRTFKRLGEFMVLGMVVFGVETIVDSSDRFNSMLASDKLHVASQDLGTQSNDEAILLDQAYRRKLHKTDSMIFQHVVRNMRLSKDSSGFSDYELFEMAERIGLLKQDPVVRARLLFRARKALQRLQPDQVPSHDDIEAYLETHATKYTQAARYRFSHVFLSRELRKDTLARDINLLKDKLTRNPLESEEAYLLGDPLLGSRPLETKTFAEIKVLYGLEMALRVKNGKTGDWSEPLSSRFGLHLIRLEHRYAENLPATSELSNQIRGELLREIEMSNYESRLATLRRKYSPRGESM